MCRGGSFAGVSLSRRRNAVIMGVLAKVFTANVDFSRSPGHVFNAKGTLYRRVSAGAPSRDDCEEAGNGDRETTCRRQQLPLFPVSRSTVSILPGGADAAVFRGHRASRR